MKQILIDLNVILDVTLDRTDHVEASAALLAAIESGRASGFLAAHGFPTFFYVVRKSAGGVRARQVVAQLARFLRVAAIDQSVIERAMSLGFADFEDAVTAVAAETAGCDLIATRDPRGFVGSPVKAVSPELALESVDSDVHEPVAVYDAPPVRRRRRRSRIGERSTAAPRR